MAAGAAAKYRRTESLTGGSGDVNPQWMTMDFTPTAAGTTETKGFATPSSRLPERSGRTMVMEVLEVVYSVPGVPSIAAVGETGFSIAMVVGTRNSGATALTWADPSVVSMLSHSTKGAFTAGGTYSTGIYDRLVHQDLTDGAGHGMLVATDTLYAQLQGAVGWATQLTIKIKYRLKNVGLTEYIGIVQSQQ